MRPPSTLSRRSLLRLIAGAGAASLAASVRQPWLTGHGQAAHPGALVALQVSDDAPGHSWVRLVVVTASARYPQPPVPAHKGQPLVLETPYPFDDLVPGGYAVCAELLDRSGSVLDRLGLGGYQVRPWRFSA